MKNLVLFSFVTLLGVVSFASPDKEFTCKNADKGLPDNVYKFTNVTVGTNLTVPMVDVTRYYREVTGDPTSKVVSYGLKGLATISTVDGNETVLLNSLRFEFKNDELLNCQK